MTLISKQLAQGLALQKQGQPEKAQAIYEQILQTDPQHFDALHLLGGLFSKHQKNQEALELFNRAIAIKPSNPGLFYNRGNVLQKLHQFELALSSYDQAIVLKPDYADAYSNRGNVLQKLHQFEPALSSYDQAIALKGQLPESENYYLNRSSLFQATGRLLQGIADLKQACHLRFNLLRQQVDFPVNGSTKPMSVPDAARALLEFKQFLDPLQIPFFIIKGTLLGIYRDGEQLPYDKDIDLGLFWNVDRKGLFDEIKKSSKFKISQPIDGDTNELNWNLVVEHISTEVVLDLFFFKPDAQSMLMGFHHLPEPFLWKFSVFELAPIHYHGEVFQMPKNPELFLSEIYGTTWRIPDPHFDSVVSGLNILDSCREISLLYAYDRLYHQLLECNWKKAFGYCQQTKAFETGPWLSDLMDWLERRIGNPSLLESS